MTHDGQLQSDHSGNQRTPSGGGVDHGFRLDGTSIGLNGGDAPACLPDSLDLGVGVYLDSHLVGLAGVTPNHSIVSDDTSGGVIESCLNRIARCRRDVDGGNHSLDFFGVDHATVHAHHLVGLGANLQAVYRGITVGQCEMALLRKE